MASEPTPHEPPDAPAPDAETPEPRASQTGAPAAPRGGLWPYLRERYFSFDRRLLGVFRVYFGLLLLVDVLRRLSEATVFYSNEGILSNHFSLFAPLIQPYFSVYTAFSTPAEVKVALCLTAVAYLFLIVGYRTRLAQVAAFVLFSSLNARNHFLENGGTIMVSLVACWTMFLPLGDRFSVDAVLKSLRARRDFTAEALNDREGITPDRTPHVTLVALCILLQISVCYFFNTAHKQGPTWLSGEAVHWVLWQNRIATPLAGWLRMHEPSWFSPLATRGTLLIEGAASLLVLIPFAFRWLRPTHFALTTVFHLLLAATLTLGPFSYIMIGLNMLALTPNVMDWLSGRARRGLTPRTVVYDPQDAGLHLVARILSRLDAFRLLTFVDRSDRARLPEKAPKASIAVHDQEQDTWTAGTAAIASATRSLPLGQAWSALLGNGLGQALLRAVLLRRKHLTESLGVEAGRPFDDQGFPHEPGIDPAPWRDHVILTLQALRESMVTVLLVTAFFQAGHDNWWISPERRLQVPRALQPIALYPRMIQGWTMFSPDIPRTDGTIVVDGLTADGRHIDPFTGQAPDFEAPLHGPWHLSQFWCDYFLKITFDGNKNYRDELKRYLFNWQRLEGRSVHDRIQSFDLYWVSCDSPPPGSTEITNIQKKLLMSGR